MTIIRLSKRELKDLINGKEIDKTLFAYVPPLIIKRVEK